MKDDTLDERLIPTVQLKPNPDNPRMEAGDVTELAHSIEEVGLLQALLVRPSAVEDDDFIIEAGYRRWVAMRALGFKEIRCHVRQPERGEDLQKRNIIVGLVENEREGLTPVEKARALGRLRDEKHMSQTGIAAATGWSLSTVSRFMALTELAPKTQEAVARGDLGVQAALQLVRQHRERQRRKGGGSGKAGAVWEPDWFTWRHPLAAKARATCDARNHSSRRRIGGIACGECLETEIREDQTVVIMARLKQQAIPMPAFEVAHVKPNGIPAR